jgi:hypothetical protein
MLNLSSQWNDTCNLKPRFYVLNNVILHVLTILIASTAFSFTESGPEVLTNACVQ